jgi:hypothetical protein
MPKTIFVIGAVALLSTTYAMVQQGAVIRECAADIRAACGDVPPGAGAIRSCLNSHEAKSGFLTEYTSCLGEDSVGAVAE